MSSVYAIGDRVVVRAYGLTLDAEVRKAYPPEYHVRTDRFPHLLLITDESEISPIPASREQLSLNLPDKHCALPGCGKPNAADASICWMCGNPV